MKKIVSLLLVLVLVFSVVACGSDGKAPESKNKGKVLIVTKNNDLNNMDPQVATDGLSFEAIAACTDGLMSTDKDGNPIKGLAKEVKVSDDGLKYTFHLRDAKWSNDKPVTAHDFVYAWRRLADPKFKSEYAYMLDVAAVKNATKISTGKAKVEELGIKALDDKTVEVTLERPIPFFEKLMAFVPFYPVNKEFVESKGKEYGSSPETTLYNGAFVWTKWQQGNSFKFVKNDKYWNKDIVKLDGLEFKVSSDPQSAILDYEQGNSNNVYLTGELVEQYKNNDKYKEHYIKQLGSYLWWLQVNNYSKKLKNQNLVKAIALAYDREQIAKNVLKDGSIGAYFFVPRKLASDKNGKDFRDSSGNYFKEGKDKAKEYWKKAKEEMKIDKFEFELLFEDTEQSKKVAEFLKSEIESTLDGFTVKLKSQPKKTRLAIMGGTEDDYDIGLTRWGPDYADPMTYLELYAPQAGKEFGRGGYKDAKYTELINKAKYGKLSFEDRWKTMIEAEKVLLSENVGVLPVYQTGKAELWDPKVKDVYIKSVGVPVIYKNASFKK